jgi:hypothetical protein
VPLPDFNALWASALELARDPEFWKYVSIPFVAGIVGWVTNWAAIQLTFYPVEFVGRRPYLGWQGIIPSKAEKMAATFVDSTMIRLGTLPELFHEMEPDKIAEQINRVIVPRLERYTDEILLRENPTIWSATPALVKGTVYAGVREQFPRTVNRLILEVRDRIEELIDFKDMITGRLVEDRALLNRLFLEAGEKEFRFIVRSGLYYGFLFGLVQLLVWFFYPVWWVLPAFGVLVGYATNWIALNLIFRPLHPTKVGPWVLHGLFLRRQKEVAGAWCHLVTRQIVTVRALVQAMLHGPKAEATRELIRKHMAPMVREAAGPLHLPAAITVGKSGFDDLAERVGEKSIALSTVPFDDWHFNRERADAVEELLRRRMEEMPSEDFQDLLRPCFQEDEIKLILVGAVLGGLAGLAQLFFVFGGI